MAYLKAIRTTLILLAVVLLNSVSFAGHTSAMSSMSHEMSSTSHKADTSVSCATLCRTALVEREITVVRDDENKEDEEPIVPFYAQNLPGYFNEALAGQKRYADSVKPPPKVPIFIQLQVFRI